uniref:TOD1/MUCI70 glycosyltransferase-like domain-containing protein n=1 Tax=Kalanchoe fedtschenkoi TaxID=63787 RepID=A0A7N0UJQ8_KALFE
MAPYKHGNELLSEISGEGAAARGVRRKRRLRLRLGVISRQKVSFWVCFFGVLFLIYLAVVGMGVFFHGKMEDENVASKIEDENVTSKDVRRESPPANRWRPPSGNHRRKHLPCEVDLLPSIDYFVDPKDYLNSTSDFALEYISKEEIPSDNRWVEPSFGGHQTLEERENSFHARNQLLHCGFVQGPDEYKTTGFDLDEKDKAYMKNCAVAVSSCIFGSSDFLRRPTSKKISDFSKKIVCFVMFVDEQTLVKLASEGHVRDEKGYIGLWRMVIVRNLPYKDMRRTGKVPKFLSHRLFPSSRYSIWVDSKLRLHSDPMMIVEYFLWRTKSEYAISNHYDRHCVWEEVAQNKRLNKYNHTAIDEQFLFYQSDGLTKFDPSDPNTPLPSYVPEGSFIVRAHTPMSNLFSCLWFNEVHRFTSRDQLSFAYTYLKLRRTNPDKPLRLYMFKDCERRALTKLFQHRAVTSAAAAAI